MTTVSHFSRLPLELRQQIWSYILPPPAIAEPDVITRHRPCWSLYQQPRLVASTPMPPLLLHICGESRIFCLSRYSLAFRRTYVDFAADIVYFHKLENWPPIANCDFQSYDNEIEQPVKAQIQHLAINMPLWNDNVDEEVGSSDIKTFPVSTILDVLQEYTKLRTLAIVIRADNCARYGSVGEFIAAPDIENEPPSVASRYEALKYHLYHRWANDRDEVLCTDPDGIFEVDMMTEERMLELLELEKINARQLIEKAKSQAPNARFPELEWRFVHWDGRGDIGYPLTY